MLKVSKYEYFGVIIDDKLNMNSHIDHIIKKVQGKLCILCKIRRYITENVALRIFKGLILCHFDYGDFVVESGNKGTIDKLDRLYKRAVRCIEYCTETCNHLSVENLYHRYKLEPLENRRKRNLLKIMYKESKEDTNIDIYRPEQVLHSTSHVKMKHKFTRITKIKKTTYYRGLVLWDNMPQNLQTIDSNLAFKNAIRGYKL